MLALLDEIHSQPVEWQEWSDADDVRRTILGFKFWVDEPGTDSVRYWSESHALCYNACAYLAGHAFPRSTFASSGLVGTELARRADARIRQWLSRSYRVGMSEWLSAKTLVEVLATLVVLVDRAPDPDLARRAKMVMDVVLLDVAMYGFEGDFAPAAARTTPDPGMRTILAWLRAAPILKSDDPLVARIVGPSRYDLPPVMQRIAYDECTSTSWSTFGLNPSDVEREAGGHADQACLLAWQIGAYTCRETIKWSLHGYHAWGLSGNRALALVKRHASPLTRLLPANGEAEFPRARLSSFRTRHYQLSSVQGYKVGQIADACPWRAVLPGGIHVTSVHPTRSGVPAGAGVLPAVGQHEHVLLALYDTRRRDVEEASKVVVPFSRLDEARVGRTWVAGQARGTFFGLLSASPLELSARDEVAQRGPVTGWAVVMGDRSQSTSLSEFVKMLKASSLTIDRDVLHLRLAHLGHYSLSPEGSVSGPQGLVVHPAGRYRNPWVRPFTMLGTTDVECGGRTLHLDWQTATRTWT